MIKMPWTTLRMQIRQNLVAIISLITALTGVSYDTWRDRHNQINENQRNAAFEMLKSLGELQTIVNYAHFKKDQQHGDPIEGWKHVLLIRDMSQLLKQNQMQQSIQLYQVWQETWETLENDPNSEAAMSAQISKARQETLILIEQLE